MDGEGRVGGNQLQHARDRGTPEGTLQAEYHGVKPGVDPVSQGDQQGPVSQRDDPGVRRLAGHRAKGATSMPPA